MKYWLLKTEPSTFSIDDFKTKQTVPWDGIRNYQARNIMRDLMKVGDRVFIYHSGVMPAIVGEGEVASVPYPDPLQFDTKSVYFDPKATRSRPRWFHVDVHFLMKYPLPILRSQLRDIRGLSGMVLLKPGIRLSIQPVRALEWKLIKRLV